MKRARWLAALLGCFLGLGEARAQGVPGGFGLGGISIGGGGIGFSLNKKKLFVSGSLGYYNLGYYSPYLYGSCGPYPYYYPPINQVTVVTAPPPPSPVVIGAPPPLFRPGLGDLGGLEEALRQQRREQLEPPVIVGERPLPGQPAGVFRPIRPEDRIKAAQPVPPDPPKPPPKPDVVKPKPPNRRPELPLPRGPEADPKAEYARLVALGREAFAIQEYGRAAERFRQATLTLPAEAQAFFLLAQAQLALGKYHEAVDAIHDGMRLHADWPQAPFRPLELYGIHVAAFPEHLRRLEDALTRNPDNPVLLFLYAYELWFDGRQEEAVALFQRALAVTPDKTFIERFLRARPGVPVV